MWLDEHPKQDAPSWTYNHYSTVCENVLNLNTISPWRSLQYGLAIHLQVQCIDSSCDKGFFQDPSRRLSRNVLNLRSLCSTLKKLEFLNNHQGCEKPLNMSIFRAIYSLICFGAIPLISQPKSNNNITMKPSEQITRDIANSDNMPLQKKTRGI